MSTAVQQTSIDSFYAITNITARQHEVYNALMTLGVATNLDIAEHLDMPINQITPRTKELVEAGIVKEAFKAPSNQTGRTSIWWKLA